MDLLGSILGSMDPIPQPKIDPEAKKRIQGEYLCCSL